ncbi:DUF5689 domain-containing protein [Sphingobacterium hungaricum]
MKKFNKLFSKLKLAIPLLALIYVFQSCEKHDYAAGSPSPYISLEYLRAVYKGQDIQLTEDKVSSAKEITGLVISNHQNGNVPEGLILMQQYKNAQFRGIAIKVGSIATNYLPGDSIVVNIENKTLKKDGYLYLDGVTESDIQKISSSNQLHSRRTNANAINSRPDVFESTLVSILGCEVFPKPTEGETLEGGKLLLNGADTVTLRTLPTADFAQEKLPRNIDIVGVLLGSKAPATTKFDILPLFYSNIRDISDPEIPGNLGAMPLIITGFVNDPNGGDGNYEYIQLRANTDIDFTEIPFSLILGTNAGAATPNPGAPPAAGWATGGGRTYKFNLTEGKVSKGEFFYVGGSQKRINGPNSTSISAANWIRTIAYTTTAGDGIGNASSGLLPNSGNAGAIGLFVGTNVGEQTVPIDAVFFGGTGTATIVDSIGIKGYRIGNNDHYNVTNQTTGEAQPLFSMGTNQYRIPHSTPTDVGFFVKLGGVFNTTTRKWTTPRNYVFHTMTKSSVISELETGENITVLED